MADSESSTCPHVILQLGNHCDIQNTPKTLQSILDASEPYNFHFIVLYKQGKKEENLEGGEVISISYEDFHNGISFRSLSLITTLAVWRRKEKTCLVEAPPSFPEFHRLCLLGRRRVLDCAFHGTSQ